MTTRETRIAALELLLVQESAYLIANGWRVAGDGTFKGAPMWTLVGHYPDAITQGHAVNAQKQMDRRAGLFSDSREAQRAFGGGDG